MPALHRQLALKLLLKLRQSRLRRPILRFLSSLHNTSYHLISFFASASGFHPKHEIIKYELFFLEHLQPSDTVLDIGCGNGKVSYHLAQKAKHVVGVDLKASNIKKASQLFSLPNLSFSVADATRDSLPGPFNAIVLSNVLEHIEHRVEFLKKLKNIAPQLLIRVPLLTRDWLTVFKKNEGFEYRLDITHYIEYTEENFRQEIEQAGLKIVHLHTAFGEIYAVAVH
jgi:2-polyprenyl-3-methyl-5-hydroxy-6-metoxy-1,4-benzoquinol methylase